MCTGCHRTDLITRGSGYTRAGWQELIGTMIDLSDSPKEQGRIVDYLATHFPPNDRRAPTLVPGEAEAAFREWVVPTLGQRSRDRPRRSRAGRSHRAISMPASSGTCGRLATATS